MTVRAVLRTGEEVELAAELGGTPEEVLAGLAADSLTGSAVPLAAAVLAAADGSTVAYRDINAFVSGADVRLTQEQP